MNEEYELGKKMGIIESDEATKRVFKLFVDNENKPSYHAEIHREVRGSKVGISRALHILDDELEVMDKFYVKIPQDRPYVRTVEVLMFQLKPEFYESIIKIQISSLTAEETEK